MRIPFILLLAIVLFTLSGPAWAQNRQAVEIVRVTPQGEDVPAARQIVVEFNRPIVPLGRMERKAEELGVIVKPELDCDWRWINTATLACNLDDEDSLKPSTRYELSFDQTIRALDGASLAQGYRHGFVTQRPEISYYNFHTWRGAAHPVIRIVFNQAVTEQSVRKHLFFQMSSGKPLRQAVDIRPDEMEAEAPVIAGNAVARRTWLVEPARDLPEDSRLSLRMEPGLISTEGPEASVTDRDIVVFDTYPDFRFVGVRCTNINNVEILIEVGKDQTAGQLCHPLRPVSLAFTAPILRSEVKENINLSPDLSGGRNNYNPWGDENRDWSYLGYPHEKGRYYYVGFPVGLKAAQSYSLMVPGKRPGIGAMIAQMVGRNVNEGMQDEFGRTLMKPVVMSFSTSHRPPNFEAPYKEVVLEKQVDSDLPFYVNNLASYQFNYTRLNALGVQTGQSYARTVPSPEDVQFAVPFGVREMLGGKPGILYGHVATEPEVSAYGPESRRLFAQVTPYHVHAKMGHYESLLWVVDFSTGQPVEGATVTLYKDELSDLSLPDTPYAVVKTDKDGMAKLPGLAQVDPDLVLTNSWRDSDARLFIRVDKGEDMALLPLSYDFYIDTWRASNETIWAVNRKKYGHVSSWGMTAQGVYRTGDTIQYKIFVRDHNNQTLVAPPRDVTYSLELTDPAGKVVLTQDNVTLSEFGALTGEYSVPKKGAVGWYEFKLGLKSPNEEPVYLYPLSVLVSDFTPAPFRVSAHMSGDRFKAGDDVEILADAKMHAGGAYTDAAIRVTALVTSQWWYEPDHPLAQGFRFDSFQDGRDSEQIFQKSEALDDQGEWKTVLHLPELKIAYGKLSLEASVQDDRGKSVAATAQADYFGVDRLVGIKSSQWVYEANKPVTLPVLVLNDKGQPAAGTSVKVSFEKEIVHTARVKGAGNAYLSDITTEWQPIDVCEHVSKVEPQECNFLPEKGGTYRAVAQIVDSAGRGHRTTQGLWVTGDDYVQWNTEGDTALPIVPEKGEYRIGDTARYLIKNPYPGAKALVTIERYGVMDSFVTTLEGSAPTIEFPVKPDYMPGYYLSVIVMSPRVEAAPAEEGQIDMGKPAFRMGYVTVPVRDPVKEMQIDVKGAQEVYRPRDKVQVNIHAQPRLEQEAKEPVELTVAVVDEAVFDLINGGRNAYDPYRGFYNLESLDLRNYSLMMRLTGRQKFEKKGANPGGDGGVDVDMRTLFKYVSYWNPGLPTDADGNARIEFKAPDNLTGWRVLVLAVTPGERMGLGEGAFKVNRPTEIRPVMPNQVREGDSFSAGFSVMNRTDATRTIRVSIEADGDIEKEAEAGKVEEVSLEPYKRAVIYLPLHAAILPASREVQEGVIHFTVTAADGTDSDALAYELPVYKSRVIDVSANYGSTVDPKIQEIIRFPDHIYTDEGGVEVVLSPSVIANLSGAFRYMRDYPYTCWEQRLTRGVMASHYLKLSSYLPDDLVWEESKVLPQETLDAAIDYQTPGGGMAYFKALDEYADPYLSAYTALAFGWLAKAGYQVPENVEKKLHDYLLNILKQEAFPQFYDAGMTSTVRAVALAALANAGKISKDDVLRYETHVKNMSLFGKAHYMQAALAVNIENEIVRDVANMILSSGQESGGKLSFNETLDNGYARILSTPLRDNCAVLGSFMNYASTEEGNLLIGDKPFKIVRTITASRGSRDYWENTQENMFCMAALVDYAEAYESEQPQMKIKTSLDQKSLGDASFSSYRDEARKLIYEIQDGDSGRQATLEIDREGQGRLYYATRMKYAIKADAYQDLNAGMELHREYSVKKDGVWALLKEEEKISRGDIVRVDLFLNLPTARNFVVVHDPLPGGLETVNRDLATASGVDAQEGVFDEAGGSFWFRHGDWHDYGYSRWSFHLKEMRHDSVNFYADWLEAGNYHLSYVAQAIADGEFHAPASRAEEMYDPDIYARGLGRTLMVGNGKP
ncbi:MAG: large extracellular alpha-helical protein [Micavibrio aeruginosavorus]|uniref:Large extracellular alpha-helical protein n=1 Tax=Micavibrio aeruginosavorus TaxID=349221 RepID=A0A7T5R1K1_9BACT|nr:MAG: large extracellular alpha-helical protein [Micavibrio aeruginosavorus]